MFTLNTLNSHNEMNSMEKKIYSRPTISETRLDSEINLVLMSPGEPGCPGCMQTEQDNQTDGTGISQFMNPLKWFR